MSAAHVAVIGLGLMSQATSRTRLRAGHPVTVRNRTQALYRRSIDDGHGTDGWTRTIDGIQVPKASA